MGSWILQPTLEHWPLLQPLMLLMLLFFLPWLGLLLVSTVLSLVAGALGAGGMARDLSGLAGSRPATFLLFGLAPPLALMVLLGQYHFGTEVPAVMWLQRITALLLVGMVLLLYYRRTQHPAAGAIGALLVLGVAFHFQSLLSLLARPEHGLFHTAPLPFIHGVQPVIWTGVFLAAAGLFTGATILVLLFHWPERVTETPEAQLPMLRRVAWGHILGGAAGLPPLLLWDLATAPSYQLEPALFSATLWTVALLLPLTLLTLAAIRRPGAGRAWLLFVLAIALFGLLAGRQQLATAAANREQAALLQERLATEREDLVAARESLYASALVVDPALGQELFNQRCTACHTFDTPGLGPAYNDVLPRYAEDLEALTEFIWRPVKVDPAYPAMPSQGLRRGEARAVAMYLLERFTGRDEERR